MVGVGEAGGERKRASLGVAGEGTGRAGEADGSGWAATRGVSKTSHKWQIGTHKLVCVAKRRRRRVVCRRPVLSVHHLAVFLRRVRRRRQPAPWVSRRRVAGRRRILGHRARRRRRVERVDVVRRRRELVHLLHLPVDTGRRLESLVRGLRGDGRRTGLGARTMLPRPEGDLAAMDGRVRFERTLLGGRR